MERSGCQQFTVDFTRQWGKGNSDKIPKPVRGERPLRWREASKQLTTIGRQGSLAWGELSFLFDVADALNVISGGERRLNT